MSNIYVIDGKEYSYPEDKEIVDKYMASLKLDYYVPEHPVEPNPSYRLKSTKDDLLKKFVRIGYSDSIAERCADSVFKDMLPEMSQNIDEWVNDITLTDIQFGCGKITFNEIFYEWEKAGIGVPSMAFFVPRMKDYILTGRNVGLLPDFL